MHSTYTTLFSTGKSEFPFGPFRQRYISKVTKRSEEIRRGDCKLEYISLKQIKQKKIYHFNSDETVASN